MASGKQASRPDVQDEQEQDRLRLAHVSSRMAAALHENPSISAKLKTALLVAVLGQTDIRSVGALARACDCDRSTLWRHWKQGIGSTDPKYVLDFVHLLRILGGGETPARGTRAYRLLTKGLSLRPTKELDLAQVVLHSAQYKQFEDVLRGRHVR
jgi:hypothetical protein